MNALKRIDINVIVIPLLTLLAFIILFVCRTLDDNRLTSWQWVFANVDAVNIYFVLILGIILAYAVSGISLSERYSIIFLFLFSYITAAVFWRAPEVIVDASRYFTQAKHLDVYGIRINRDSDHLNLIYKKDVPNKLLLKRRGKPDGARFFSKN